MLRHSLPCASVLTLQVTFLTHTESAENCRLPPTRSLLAIQSQLHDSLQPEDYLPLAYLGLRG